MKISTLIISGILVFGLTACSGMRQSGPHVTAHAESFNILGLRIPGDSHEAAMAQLPPGTQVHTIDSKPSDWTSLPGIVNRLIGISYTEVSGQVVKQ